MNKRENLKKMDKWTNGQIDNSKNAHTVKLANGQINKWANEHMNK